MIAFFQANAGPAIVLAIITGSILVLCLIGLLMKRAGVSLKPLWWFAGFMLLILLPQLAGHLVNAYMKERALTTRNPSDKERPLDTDPAKSPVDLDYSDPEKLFGKRNAGILVLDGRATAGGLLHPAENPKWFILPGGETLLIGRFPSAAEAEKALAKFLQESRLAERARPDGAGGLSVERGPLDFIYARAHDNLFTVWTGPSEMAIGQLQIATGFKGARASPSPDGARGNITAGSSEWLDTAIKTLAATGPGLAIVIAAPHTC